MHEVEKTYISDSIIYIKLYIMSTNKKNTVIEETPKVLLICIKYTKGWQQICKESKFLFKIVRNYSCS